MVNDHSDIERGNCLRLAAVMDTDIVWYNQLNFTVILEHWQERYKIVYLVHQERSIRSSTAP